MTYTPDGELLSQWGEYGTGDAQFIYPTGIALLNEGRMAISEYGTDAERVRIFDTEHKLLAGWGKLGTEPGELDRAMAIDVDAAGLLFVADTANHRVQCFDQSGKLLHLITGSGDHTLVYPHDLKCAVDGTVLIAEYGANRISRFTGEGTFIESIGSAGREPGQFAAPRGVTVDVDGVMFVADTDNHRIQRFSIKLNPPAKTLTQSKQVIPAKAGIQKNQGKSCVALDSRFRGNDSVKELINTISPGRASA
jgi:sugar lactone lactonase YvrE